MRLGSGFGALCGGMMLPSGAALLFRRGRKLEKEGGESWDAWFGWWDRRGLQGVPFTLQQRKILVFLVFLSIPTRTIGIIPRTIFTRDKAYQGKSDVHLVMLSPSLWVRESSVINNCPSLYSLDSSAKTGVSCPSDLFRLIFHLIIKETKESICPRNW